MRTSIAFALILGSAAPFLSHAGDPPQSLADRATREAVIAAATQAIHKHMKADPQERKGTEIAKESWGEAIARLKPLRVRDDRLNVLIVLQEDETTEEGLYVSNLISSYAPGADQRFLRFEKVTGADDRASGVLYYCRVRKAQSVGAPDATAPRR